MRDFNRHYIGARWVNSEGTQRQAAVNPATAEAYAEVTLGTTADVDKAVEAALKAKDSFAATSPQARIALLTAILQEYMKHREEVALAITEEIGCPIALSRAAQAPSGMAHLQAAIHALKSFPFEEVYGRSQLVHEPIGVVGLITPWNWPMNQISAKVAAAIAAGCVMVLKPSELAPLSAHVFARIIDAAGVPAGVFNLVQGDGAGAGAALSRHPQVDMISFTGSTRAGIAVAKNAADTVKRVHQELGGKSPSIVLPDTDFDRAIHASVRLLMMNSGQSCTAPSRLLVPVDRYEEAIAMAASSAKSIPVGDPTVEGPHIGPLANERQFEKVQSLIEQGVKEGAIVAAGGSGRPSGQERGYFIQPTVFGQVTNDMVVAKEEIFGPVLTILPYEEESDAVRIANDTPYGLAAYLWTNDSEASRRIARQIKAGSIHVNGGGVDFGMPFGGYKQSGNGREFGAHGIREFLEVKSVLNPN